MPRRNRTPVQSAYSLPGDFVEMVRAWREDAIEVIFGYVWKGFDELLSRHKFARTKENLERGVTQLACQYIRDAMDGKPPFYLEHHPFEDETRKPAPASPPAPDLAFILRGNPRAMLPLEAKILPTDRAVADYVREVRDNFLECRYAPFSSHGGVLGYLVQGSPALALESIALALDCELRPHPRFSKRNHRCSKHERTSERCRKAPRSFTCHHLVFLLRGPSN
jgi:hypothetical protein